MFVTGPDVVKTVTNEVVTQEELGGAITHTTKTSVADLALENDIEALLAARDFFDFLPLEQPRGRARAAQRRSVGPPRGQPRHADPGLGQPALRHARGDPEGARRGRFLRDPAGPCRQHHLRLRPGRGPHGRRRRQPADGAGRRARHQRSKKAARFVRFCDAFNIPILTFVDVPGFLPGTNQEHNGIIKHGAKLLFAYAEATVPKITVITRKAYGGAYDVMALQALARRPQLRLADRRDRGDGRQGRGRDHLPRPGRRRRSPRRPRNTKTASPTPSWRRARVSSTR